MVQLADEKSRRKLARERLKVRRGGILLDKDGSGKENKDETWTVPVECAVNAALSGEQTTPPEEVQRQANLDALRGEDV